MRIITININGIRSAFTKGLFAWIQAQNADIICFQEIKASIEDIPQEILTWNNYYCKFHPAKKKGYSGVAIFAKQKPENIIIGLNNEEIDNEGRYIQFDYHAFSVASIYLPSGSSGVEKQEKKFKFMQFYAPLLTKIIQSGRSHIICGDWNIAHQEIDLKNWKANTKNSGFLPSERQWLSDIFGLGFVDNWRYLYPQEPGYTWWSNRGAAYSKNVGWRIDYQISTPDIAKKLITASVFRNIKFSDHAPLIMDYTM